MRNTHIAILFSAALGLVMIASAISSMRHHEPDQTAAETYSGPAL